MKVEEKQKTENEANSGWLLNKKKKEKLNKKKKTHTVHAGRVDLRGSELYPSQNKEPIK